MLEAIGLGALAQVTLLLSGLIVFWISIKDRHVGWLAGLGAGMMLAAVAFDLTDEAEALGGLGLAIWFVIGGTVFLVAERIVDTRFGSDEGSALGIVLGSVIDGVPESLIFGIGIATGDPISVSFLAAVMISNLPQAIAPSADLRAQGWSMARLATMWAAVIVSCGVASGLGFLAATVDPAAIGDRAAGVAAGGILAMLALSLVPFAVQRGGRSAAVFLVAGFALSVALS
jgi:ZIP family zinc transporter